MDKSPYELEQNEVNFISNVTFEQIELLFNDLISQTAMIGEIAPDCINYKQIKVNVSRKLYRKHVLSDVDFHNEDTNY